MGQKRKKTAFIKYNSNKKMLNVISGFNPNSQPQIVKLSAAGTINLQLQNQTIGGTVTLNSYKGSNDFWVDCTNGNHTIILPDISTTPDGFSMRFTRTDSSGNTCTLQGFSGTLINGANTSTMAVSSRADLVCLNSIWRATKYGVTF